MKKIIVLIFVLIFVSCVNDNEKVILDRKEYEKLLKVPKPEYPKPLPTPSVIVNSINNNLRLVDFQVIQIDGCEYIFATTKYYDGGSVLTHKGNCKNKSHYENR